MIKQNYEIEVTVNGRPLKEYIHNGKVYIEGKQDSVFSLKIRNNSWKRKLFIPSIDGLSVIDGKDASFGSEGYIVNAHSSITIDGWRISDKEVASFYFSSAEDSYRKRMKKGNNLGVIGCAVFDEKERETFNFYQKDILRGAQDYPRAMFSCSSVQGSALSESANVSNALGTGWGESKKSEVVTIGFDKAQSPTAVFEIFYNTREQLEKLGLSFKEPLYVAPQAFPGSYCEAPKD